MCRLQWVPKYLPCTFISAFRNYISKKKITSCQYKFNFTLQTLEEEYIWKKKITYCQYQFTKSSCIISWHTNNEIQGHHCRHPIGKLHQTYKEIPMKNVPEVKLNKCELFNQFWFSFHPNFISRNVYRLRQTFFDFFGVTLI